MRRVLWALEQIDRAGYAKSTEGVWSLTSEGRTLVDGNLGRRGLMLDSVLESVRKWKRGSPKRRSFHCPACGDDYEMPVRRVKEICGYKCSACGKVVLTTSKHGEWFAVAAIAPGVYERLTAEELQDGFRRWRDTGRWPLKFGGGRASFRVALAFVRGLVGVAKVLGGAALFVLSLVFVVRAYEYIVHVRPQVVSQKAVARCDVSALGRPDLRLPQLEELLGTCSEVCITDEDWTGFGEQRDLSRAQLCRDTALAMLKARGTTYEKADPYELFKLACRLAQLPSSSCAWNYEQVVRGVALPQP